MNNQKPHFITLFLLMSFSSVIAVAYTPALPAIEQFFAVTASQAQYTMTAYLLGFAIGPLIYGPFSNRFGRRPTLKVGLFLTLLVTLLCILAGGLHWFWVLVVLRFFQALAAASGMTIALTMVGDYYQQHTAKVMPLVMSSFAIMPGLTTMLCGYLVHRYGWLSCFYFMMIYMAIILVMVYWLPETGAERDLDALNWRKIGLRYAAQLTHKKVVLMCVLMGLASALIYIYASAGPFLGIVKVGISPSQYGLWMLIPYLCMTVGSLTSAWLAHYFHPFKILACGVGGVIACGIAMILAFVFNGVEVWSLFGITALLFLFELYVFANASSIISMSVPDKSNVSAVMSMINMAIPFTLVQIVAESHNLGILVMPVAFLIVGMVMLVVAYWLKRARVV